MNYIINIGGFMKGLVFSMLLAILNFTQFYFTDEYNSLYLGIIFSIIATVGAFARKRIFAEY